MLLGHCPVLDIATELKLGHYIKLMENKLFGLTRKNVIEITFILAYIHLAMDMRAAGG